MDFEPYFIQYETLLQMSDDIFNKVKSDFPECVKCEVACSDCCYALFDLTLIEALYVNYHFQKTFEGQEREKRLEIANQIDRKLYQLKRKAYKEMENGKSESDILRAMAAEKVRCPLLNEQSRCDLYQYRPITCRIYGIPTSIAGESHTCGISGFKEGEPYPTVKLETIQKKLYQISAELAKAVGSRYSRMGEMLIPLSMALLTEYDEAYLGVKTSQKEENAPNE